VKKERDPSPARIGVVGHLADGLDHEPFLQERFGILLDRSVQALETHS
jgi:hypothetical protein